MCNVLCTELYVHRYIAAYCTATGSVTNNAPLPSFPWAGDNPSRIGTLAYRPLDGAPTVAAHSKWVRHSPGNCQGIFQYVDYTIQAEATDSLEVRATLRPVNYLRASSSLLLILKFVPHNEDEFSY